MNLLRFGTAFSFALLLAYSASAQAVDWKSLGKPLDDDTKAMTDRYVYSQAETTTDKNVGIDKPVLAPNDVAEWITQRIPELFALSAKDYDQKMVVSQIHFTPKGYGQYVKSLIAAQLPLVVKEKNFTLSAMVPDPPIVTAKGLRDDADKTVTNPVPKMVYVWQLDTPVNLGYRSPGLTFEVKTYKVLIKVDLVRIPMKEDGTLIAIDGWRLEEYKPTLLPTSSAKPEPQKSFVK